MADKMMRMAGRGIDGTAKPLSVDNEGVVNINQYTRKNYNVLTVPLLEVGAEYIQQVVNCANQSIKTTQLNIVPDRKMRITLEVSIGLGRYTNIFSVTVPRLVSLGTEDDYRTFFTPVIEIPSQFYRWIVKNIDTSAPSLVEVTEITSTQVEKSETSLFTMIANGVPIRSTNLTDLDYVVLSALGSKPKSIFMENSMNQDVTLIFKTQRNFAQAAGDGKYEIATVTVKAGAKEVLSFADNPLLAGAIHKLICTAQCTIAPTGGFLFVSVGV